MVPQTVNEDLMLFGPSPSPESLVAVGSEILRQQVHEPRLALKSLATSIDRIIASRLQALSDREEAVERQLHDRITAFQTAEKATIPSESDMARMMTDMRRLEKEGESLDRQAKKSSTRDSHLSLRRQKTLLRKMKKLESRAVGMVSDLRRAQERADAQLAKVSSITKTAATSATALRTHSRLLRAEISLGLRRFIFLLVSLWIAFVLAWQTPLLESIALTLFPEVKDARVPVVILVFALELLILQPTFDRLESRRIWRGYGQLLRTAEEVFGQLSEAEERLSAAESVLEK